MLEITIAKALGIPILGLVCWWILRKAKQLDAEGNAAARKQLAHLLTSGNVTRAGEVMAHLAPTMFERWFGTKPLEFIATSLVTTTVFWMLLVLLRNRNPEVWRLGAFESHTLYNWVVVLLMYVVDVLSLLKARFLINKIISRNKIKATLLFFLLDILASYTLPLLLVILLSFTSISPMYAARPSDKILFYVGLWLRLKPITDYLYHRSYNVHLINVLIPTTLLTSIWTAWLFISVMVAIMLLPLEYVRRFIAWWYGDRDIERRPLTVIATIANIIIMIVGFVFVSI